MQALSGTNECFGTSTNLGQIGPFLYLQRTPCTPQSSGMKEIWSSSLPVKHGGNLKVPRWIRLALEVPIRRNRADWPPESLRRPGEIKIGVPDVFPHS